MRLFSKMFFSITTILCLALAVTGCFLMSASFTESLERETERTIETWRMTGYVLQSSLGRRIAVGGPYSSLFEQVVPDILHSGVVSLFDEDGTLLYSEYQGEEEPSMPGFAADEDPYGRDARGGNVFVRYGVQTLDETRVLTVCGPLYLANHKLYLTLSSDITDLVRLTERQLTNYRFIYICVCILSLVAVGFFVARMAGPIDRTAKSAALIAEGNYRTRVTVSGDDELGDLAGSFNRMASAVEKSVEAINESARAKDDFVGNFAHELKTPLTSVIGYADMLAQKDLTEEQVKSYAHYILDEGLRLEALSYKLMELIVLNRQDFVFEALSVREMIENIAESMVPMMREKRIETKIRVQDAYLRVEFDLFKTMLLNILDNAAKADAHTVTIHGAPSGDDEAGGSYTFEITDDGRGMPKEVLSRITEAFYMVDKSRSRAQHGAGLGLSLVKRITELHHAELSFDSAPGEGTTVRIVMPLRKEDNEETGKTV